MCVVAAVVSFMSVGVCAYVHHSKFLGSTKVSADIQEALQEAAPYLRRGIPVPVTGEGPLHKFHSFWSTTFVQPLNDGVYVPISAPQQELIDSLGLTHIVRGMRDGTLRLFNPEGERGHRARNNMPATKCSLCHAVVFDRYYPNHLHVDVGGVEGAAQEEPSEVCAGTFWCDVGWCVRRCA